MPAKKSSKPARSLGKKDMKKVRGGSKLIGSVKYNDFTIESGTGTTSPTKH